MLLRNVVAVSICALASMLPAVAVPQTSTSTSTSTSTTSTAGDSTGTPGVSGGTFTNVRITLYNASLGACGETNTDNDEVLALSTSQWEDGKYCNKAVTVTVNGKTKDGVVKDRCMGCQYGDIDLTPALFGYFADASLGHVQGDWSFKDAGASTSQSSTTSTDPAVQTTTT